MLQPIVKIIFIFQSKENLLKEALEVRFSLRAKKLQFKLLLSILIFKKCLLAIVEKDSTKTTKTRAICLCSIGTEAAY
jgi:hypothetical protein